MIRFTIDLRILFRTLCVVRVHTEETIDHVTFTQYTCCIVNVVCQSLDLSTFWSV